MQLVLKAKNIFSFWSLRIVQLEGTFRLSSPTEGIENKITHKL